MMTVIGVPFCFFDAGGVFLRHEANAHLRALGQVQRVHEAEALERLVIPGEFVVRVLDVQAAM